MQTKQSKREEQIDSASDMSHWINLQAKSQIANRPKTMLNKNQLLCNNYTLKVDASCNGGVATVTLLASLNALGKKVKKKNFAGKTLE